MTDQISKIGDIKAKANHVRRAVYGSASYLGTVLSSQLFGVVKSIVTPIIFAPSQLGVWNLSNVILSYGANSHLGVLHGMNRLYPIATARGQTEQATKIQSNAFVLNMLFSALVSLGLLVSYAFVPENMRWTLCILAFVNLAQGIFSYYTCILRSTKAFGAVGLALVVFSIVSTLTLCITWYLPNRLHFALAGLGLAYILAAAFQMKKAPKFVSWRVDRPTVASLFRVGLPMAGTVMIDTLFLSVDRWVLLSKVSTAELGYYALPVMCASFLASIPTTLSNILFPRFLERFAKGESISSTAGLFDMSYLLVSYVHLFVVFSCTALLPIIIRLFLPKYLAASPFFEWLLPASYLYSLAALPSSFLIAINKFKYLAMVSTLLLAINLLLALQLVQHGTQGVIWSTSISYGLFGLTYLLIAQYYSSFSKIAATTLVLRIGIPFVTSSAAIYAIHRVISVFQVDHSNFQSLAYTIFLVSGGALLILTSMLACSWKLVKTNSLIDIVKCRGV